MGYSDGGRQRGGVGGVGSQEVGSIGVVAWGWSWACGLVG